MATLSAVSPAEVHNKGGQILDLTGSFVVGREYRVFIGPTASVDDAECHSGAVGRQGTAVSDDGVALRTYTPQLVVYSGLHVLVLDTVTSSLAVLPSAVIVRKADYSLLTFSLRGLLPRDWRTGPRGIDRLPTV